MIVSVARMRTPTPFDPVTNPASGAPLSVD